MPISDSYLAFNLSHQIQENSAPEKPLIVVRITWSEAIFE
jgi:hypothetical protein